MVGGRGLMLSDECRVRASELIVAIELAPAPRGGRDDIVRQASVVRREWLGELDEQVVAHLDETTGRFITRLERSWKGLVIEDKPSALEGAALQAARHVALVEFARAKPERAFDLAADAVVDLSGRVTFARAALGEETDEAPPAFDPIVFVLTHVEALTSDKQSLQALKAIDLASAYMHQLSYTQGQALEREAPARLTLPNGETAALRYDPERGPILKVRIQQLFGWQATPTIGRARHPVLLELCAPNGRPQQITQDLAGFWSGSYQLVRKDLRGRYPKHPWPDDPASAAPVQRRHRSR
jgi:ATP-dependent helicase HrpB